LQLNKKLATRHFVVGLFFGSNLVERGFFYKLFAGTAELTVKVHGHNIYTTMKRRPIVLVFHATLTEQAP
jgi:hypothetical protein